MVPSQPSVGSIRVGVTLDFVIPSISVLQDALQLLHGRHAYPTVNDNELRILVALFSLPSSSSNPCLHREFTLARIC